MLGLLHQAKPTSNDPTPSAIEPPGAPSAKHDVICIASIDWHDRLWQGHQEIMATLAAQGHRVLFIENTGVRAPTWRDLPRLRRRFLNWWRSTRGFRKEYENLFLYAPCLLPFPYARPARWINRWWILRDVRQWMNAMGFDRPVVWTFLPTPLAGEIIRALNPKLAIYYCIDNLAVSSPAAHRIGESEQDMFRLADTVFTTSLALFDHASAAAKDVHLFPFGVNFERFEVWRERGAQALPDDVAAIPGPRMGYVGGLHRWVDQELLCRIADMHPDWSLVLVGPIQTDVSRLASRNNIHLLDGKPHEALPSYMASFDVAMIPYAVTSYTQCVYPTKMNEYFAMGTPVVSTPLREVLALNERHGQAVLVGGDAVEFASRLAEALREEPEGVEHRITLARQNNWPHRIDQMMRLIEQRIADRTRERTLRWQQLFAGWLGRVQVRVLQCGIAALVIYLLFCQTPLMWCLAEPLKLDAAPRSADAIVVFAGGVGESGQAGQGYEERVERAVELYQAGYASRLVFSSGYTRVFREPEVMRALAVSLGVPADAITLEETASNTYQNVQSVADILRRQGARSMLVVSSPYHMRRIALVVHRHAQDLEMIPAPVESPAFYAHTWGASLRQVRGLLHEYLGIFSYRLKGWL